LFLIVAILNTVDPSGYAVEGVGLQPLKCRDCGLKSCGGHGRLLWVLCVVR